MNERVNSTKIKQLSCNAFTSYAVNDKPMDRGGRPTEMNHRLESVLQTAAGGVQQHWGQHNDRFNNQVLISGFNSASIKNYFWVTFGKNDV